MHVQINLDDEAVSHLCSDNNGSDMTARAAAIAVRVLGRAKDLRPAEDNQAYPLQSTRDSRNGG